MDLALANSQEEIQVLSNGDGAKNAFALLFGWVPGVFVTLVAWGIARVWRWFRLSILKIGVSAQK